MDFRESWESLHDTLVRSAAFPTMLTDLDYLGVSLRATKAPCFKAYFSSEYSDAAENEIVCFLRENDMVDYCEAVSGTGNSAQTRWDWHITNCTRANMEGIIDKLKNQMPFSPRAEAELRKIDATTSASVQGEDQPRLVHLGLGFRGGRTDVAKFYFWVSKKSGHYDPAAIHLHDAALLALLRETAIPQFDVLASKAEQVLSTGVGYLWMLGIDIEESGLQKYKIYIYNRKLPLAELAACFDAALAVQLEQFAAWLVQHTEYVYDALAIGIDGKGEISLNLYLMVA